MTVRLDCTAGSMSATAAPPSSNPRTASGGSIARGVRRLRQYKAGTRERASPHGAALPCTRALAQRWCSICRYCSHWEPPHPPPGYLRLQERPCCPQLRGRSLGNTLGGESLGQRSPDSTTTTGDNGSL